MTTFQTWLLAQVYLALILFDAAAISFAVITLKGRRERKKKAEERKPNPNFTPPPEKKPPAPPTTGSAAIKPKYGISADEAAKLVSKLSEASARLGGNSVLDELRERVKEFEARPVNVFNPAEESAEAYFLEIRGGIGNKVVDTVKMCCGSCRWHDDNGLCHCEAVCNPEKLPFYGAVKRPSDHLPCKHWEIGTITDNRGKEAPVQTTHICKNCKRYLAKDENAKVGLCGMKGEIAFGNSYRACFEKREGEWALR